MTGPRTARAHDVVLFGATGYTGRLVAERLARAREPVRWALAGRDRAKLERLRANLTAQVPECPDMPIVIGDANDRAAMDAIASAARVVCTTAGPSARYGSELVAACARTGTDYCDLAGEVPWVRRMIDAHHEEARRSGARIVHCCGFDSIPSDIGVLVLQEEARRRTGHAAERVAGLLGESRGRFSGGTLASLLGVLVEAAQDPAARRTLANPYALDPDPSRRGRDGPDPRSVGFDREHRLLTAPFVMATINMRIVRRTHALLGYPWPGFSYREVMSFPVTPRGLAQAAGVTTALAGVRMVTRVRALRTCLEKILPTPGRGPSQEERARGHFALRIVGDSGTERFAVTVADQADPGYGSTSKMLASSALCLARDDLPSPGGVLTPATAMGLRLLSRLREAGLVFDLEVIQQRA